MSDTDSDIDYSYFKTPTIQDQLIDLQHFMCDLTRKLGTIEDKVLENQDELYRLQVRLNQHQVSYTKITAVIIYVITITLLLISIENLCKII